MSKSLATNRNLLNKTTKNRLNRWKNDPIRWKDYSNLKNGSYAERQFLYRIPIELGFGNYADVGVLKGQSSVCLLEGINDSGFKSSLYSVDLFVKEAKQTPANLKKYVIEKKINTNLNICEGDSSYWGNKLNLNFNFVFIDGDHSYLGAKKDWEAWSRLIKVDGLIAFHDCHVLDVDKVINEIDSNKWKMIDHIYSIKVFKRLSC